MAELNLSWTYHKDNGLLLLSILCIKDKYLIRKEAKLSNMASLPVPVGPASGPPLDGWHWAMISWSPLGTEWSSHSHPEAGSCKHDLLCPAQDQQGEEMWTLWLGRRADNHNKRIIVPRLSHWKEYSYICKICSITSNMENLSSRCSCFLTGSSWIGPINPRWAIDIVWGK